jgi:hypothetical protein
MSMANNDFKTAALTGGNCKYNSRILAILSSLLSMSNNQWISLTGIILMSLTVLTRCLNKIVVQFVGEDWFRQVTKNFLEQFTANVRVSGRINTTDIRQATRGKHLRQIIDLVRVTSNSENTFDIIA